MEETINARLDADAYADEITDSRVDQGIQLIPVTKTKANPE
jgi:hypothetical protein